MVVKKNVDFVGYIFQLIKWSGGDRIFMKLIKVAILENRAFFQDY
jgi:hypothetical protein